MRFSSQNQIQTQLEYQEQNQAEQPQLKEPSQNAPKTTSQNQFHDQSPIFEGMKVPVDALWTVLSTYFFKQ